MSGLIHRSGDAHVPYSILVELQTETRQCPSCAGGDGRSPALFVLVKGSVPSTDQNRRPKTRSRSIDSVPIWFYSLEDQLPLHREREQHSAFPGNALSRPLPFHETLSHPTLKTVPAPSHHSPIQSAGRYPEIPIRVLGRADGQPSICQTP